MIFNSCLPNNAINFYLYPKAIIMSLLNQQNNKGKKKGNKKGLPAGNNQGSKFIQKPKNNVFVNRQSNTGAQRGS